MAKYKNIKELAEAIKSGELQNWILIVDNDSTYLQWIGNRPDEAEDFEEQKYEEGKKLWDSPDVYILGQALEAAGIPNESV